MLIENQTFDGKYYVGRTYMDIPEEDGLVFIPNTKSNLENTWTRVKITGVKNYDLIGELKKSNKTTEIWVRGNPIRTKGKSKIN